MEYIDIQRLFPFYDRAPIINRKIELFDLNNSRYLREFSNEYSIELELNELIGELTKYIDIVHIVPNDIYIYTCNDDITRFLVSSYKGKIEALVTNIDYSIIAERLYKIDNKVYLRHGNGYEGKEYKTYEYIEDAIKGRESYIHDTGGEELLYKPVIETLSKGLSIKSNKTPYIDEIESYLRSDDETEQIPLLVGLSGIAKSAIVKELTEKLDRDMYYRNSSPTHKYGMRLVDFRVAFMSALDINGMFKQDRLSDGTVLTRVSPTKEFFTCTDEFIEFAYKMVNLLEQKLAILPLENEDRVKLEKLLETFKYYCKIPVFFFDEITRSSIDIQGALTTILNQRLYQQYHLRRARMIAATNMPVVKKKFKDDKEKELYEDKLSTIFIRTNIRDVALVDRFTKIKITPEDVQDSWFRWAEGKINKSIIDFLKINPIYLYDVTPIIESNSEEFVIGKVIPTYPSYRAWENVSIYLDYTVEYNKSINPDIIRGLIGKDCTKVFLDYLTNSDIGENFVIGHSRNKKNKLSEIVKDTLDSGLPLLMVGVPGIGKTSRIRKYSRDNGYDFLLIALSTMDRTELMGAATQQDFVKYLSRENSEIIDKLEIEEDINNIKHSIQDFPNTLTVRSPRYDLRMRIENCIRTGQKIVLMFDEANRCLLGSTKIKMLDGSVKTLKELHDVFGSSPFWVYSCDSEGKFIPGRACSLGVTRKQAKLVEVLLDNNEVITCTPDHKFMLKSGEYKEAKDLVENDSLMACYFTSRKGRELISIRGDKYEYTHRLVAHFKEKDYDKKGLVAHHIDRNKLNNSPDNIKILTYAEHMKEHRKEATAWTKNPTESQLKILRETLCKNFMNNTEKRERNRLNTILDKEKGEKFRQSRKERCNTEGFKKIRSKITKEQWRSGQFDNINREDALRKNRSTQLVRFLKKLINMGYEVDENNYESLRKQYTGKNNPKSIAYRASHLGTLSKSTNFNNISEAIELAKLGIKDNHKVKAVRYIDKQEDVYDINVEGTHNFLVYLEDNSGVFVHNCIDPITQSIIFKAISDQEIFGIKFPKDMVKIVVAGNLAGGMTSGARAFDSALYARCVTYIQSDYTIEDAENIIEYMKANNFSNVLINFITNRIIDSKEQIVKWIKSIEEASLLNNVPTSRTLQTLSDILKRKPLPEGDPLFGALLCPREEDILEFNSNLKDYNTIKEMAEMIDSRLDRWSGINCYDFYEEKGIKYTLKNDKSETDAIKIFRETIYPNLLSEGVRLNYSKSKEEGIKFKEAVAWIRRFLEIDNEIKLYRKEIFENIAGKDFTELFLEYYNEVSGTQEEVITVNSILDESKIDTFVKSEMNQCYINGVYNWSKIIEMVIGELGKTCDDNIYLKLINSCIDYDLQNTGGAVENSREELRELLSNDFFSDLVLRVEYNINQDYIDLINKINYSMTDYNKVSANSFVGKSLY